MPDTIEVSTLELSQEQPNAAKQNAEVATKLADQGRELNKPATEITTLETTDALENLRAAAVKKKSEDAAAKEETEDATPVVEAKEPSSKEEKKTETPTVEDKKETPPPSDDIFSGINLPPNIKPKSAEAFAAVKSKALEEISARDTKLAELEKQLKDLEEKVKAPVPDEVHKELEELRSFRAKLDVEADPKFKTYDKEIKDNHNFIYSQLLSTGKITQEHIDQIKKYGGPSKVNLKNIFEAINDPTVQRIVESKVADEAMLTFKKEQAIKETKENIGKYLSEREQEFTKATKAHNEATQKQFVALTAKMDWTQDRPVPKGADDATKAEIKAHNEFVAGARKDLEAALQDDTPEMRAILLAGMGQLLHLQRVHKTVADKLASTEKALAEANGKLERIKGASRSRLPESSAPVNVKPVEVKKDDYLTPAGDAIENIRKQILAEKANAANA